jgi:hypothetical protein
LEKSTAQFTKGRSNQESLEKYLHIPFKKRGRVNAERFGFDYRKLLEVRKGRNNEPDGRRMKLRNRKIGSKGVVGLDGLVLVLAAGLLCQTGAIAIILPMVACFVNHATIPITPAQPHAAHHRLTPAEMGGNGEAQVAHQEQNGQRYGQEFFHRRQNYTVIPKKDLHNIS